MYVKSIVATTRLIRDTIITLEALESAARKINENSRKLVLIVDHDHTCPPLGVTVAASIVPIDDGHHALQTISALYDDPFEVILPNGSIGLCQGLSEYPFPLSSGEFDNSFIPKISLDPANFGGYEGAKNISTRLSNKATDLEYEVGIIERRSLIPDPEVIFSFGTALSASWIGLRFANALGNALEPKLKRFFDVIFDTIAETCRDALPITRPITYIARVNGKPNLEFIVRSRDPHTVASAYAGDFAKVAEEVERLRQRFDVEMIQFLLNENGDWEFNFLVTGDGKTIGTKLSFDRRAVLLDQISRVSQENLQSRHEG